MAIIKAGSYVWNDRFPLISVNLSGNGEYSQHIPLHFLGTSSDIDVAVECVGLYMRGTINSGWAGIDRFDYYLAPEFSSLADNGEFITVMTGTAVEHQWFYSISKTFTVLDDVEVADNIAIWFENSTKSLNRADIRYSGKSIATVNTGEKVTLLCKDLPMFDNVTIEVM